MTDPEQLTELLDSARELTDPEYVNVEYVRGQANLICSWAGLSTDVYGDLITAVISHQESTQTAVEYIANRDDNSIGPRPGHSAAAAAFQAVTPGGLTLGALAAALSAEDLRNVIAQAGLGDPRIRECLPFISGAAVSLAACAQIIDQAGPATSGSLLGSARELRQAAVAISKATAQSPEQPGLEVPITQRAALLRARWRRQPSSSPQPDAGPLPAEAGFAARKAALLADTMLPGYLAGAVRDGQAAPGMSPAFILPDLAAAASFGWCANSATAAAVHAGAPFGAAWPIEQAAQSLWTASAQLRAAWAQVGAPVIPASPAARAVQPEPRAQDALDFPDDLSEGLRRRPARSRHSTSQPGEPGRRATSLLPGRGNGGAPKLWKPGHP